jgi:NYN domain
LEVDMTGPQPESQKVALLIDADNLSSASVKEAFEHLNKLGAFVSIRRAYGGLEKFISIKEVLRRYSVSAFVNQGKGTTDVALVVDAMDLLHRGALPATVAVGSSDADFAPLATRLREAGIRTICFAQREKAAEELPRSYDEVIYVDSPLHSSPSQLLDSDRQLTAGIAPLKPLRVTSVHSSVATAATSKGSNAQVPDNSIPSSPIHEDPAAVRRILTEVPGWLPGTIKQLNQLGKPLRESGIKKGGSPLYELFRKYPTYFKVLPITGPAKQVRLLKLP